MATIATIQSEIHRATCAELDGLKTEADGFVTGSIDIKYAINHWYREFNRRKFFLCAQSGVITPYDGGLRPVEHDP